MPTYTKREPCVLPDGRDGFYVEGVVGDGDPFVGYENADAMTEAKAELAAAETEAEVEKAKSQLPSLLTTAVTSGTIVGLVEALKVVLS